MVIHAPLLGYWIPGEGLSRTRALPTHSVKHSRRSSQPAFRPFSPAGSGRDGNEARRGEGMRSQLMEETIRRLSVLFSELSFRVVEDERSHNAYSATFEDDDASQAGVLIERGSRFLEL